jgi:hypothetical protein
MINSYRFAVPICVCLGLVAYGCASRPDEQIQLAEDAMKQAVDQHAEQYAPGEWKSAQEAWDQAQAQLSQEQFASAATSFVTAKARLLKAAEVAKEERESMQKQVADLQAIIDTNYAELKTGATPARLAGGLRKEYETALADVDKRIALVRTQMEQGDYITAKANAQGALQAIDFIAKKLRIPSKSAR